jgi:hypothetical protein
VPAIRTIIQFFRDLLDVPEPEPGRYLRWNALSELENSDAVASMRVTATYKPVATVRVVPLQHRGTGHAVTVNGVRQGLEDCTIVGQSVQFEYDLILGDEVTIDYDIV